MDATGEIRSQLVERLSALERRMGRIRGERRREAAPLDPDWEEQVVERENDEVLDALDDAGQRELQEIRDTLGRMDRGEFGRCLGCGQPIPEGRLRALPTATRCTRCAD